MPGNMVATDLVGAGRPCSRRESDRNPGLASAVVETTASDGFGFMLFLGIASASVSPGRAGQECPG